MILARAARARRRGRTRGSSSRRPPRRRARGRRSASGARPRFVCTITPVALSTRRSAGDAPTLARRARARPDRRDRTPARIALARPVERSPSRDDREWPGPPRAAGRRANGRRTAGCAATEPPQRSVGAQAPLTGAARGSISTSSAVSRPAPARRPRARALRRSARAGSRPPCSSRTRSRGSEPPCAAPPAPRARSTCRRGRRRARAIIRISAGVSNAGPSQAA